ncbi:MAG: hypothetical protein CVU98_09770 [Firmicutes bacterium HGW-Firmicutes-3]|jgi:hypothetical protein|nr:MAG: hypothetical protein CVU98_09770 [Firmicutes bacterium HGW-Firmicutes-3]
MKKIIKKMMNKIIIMTLVMVLMSTTIVHGATNEESYAGNQLRTLGILRGYDDGSLKLDIPIVRAEVSALAVRILGYEGVEVAGESKSFADVPTSHWAHGVIGNANKLKLVQGYPGDTFRPAGNITYGEIVTIMVNVLGRQENLTGKWPENYIQRAKSIGVIPANSSVNPSKVVTRGEVALIIWDTLLVKQ